MIEGGRVDKHYRYETLLIFNDILFLQKISEPQKLGEANFSQNQFGWREHFFGGLVLVYVDYGFKFF